MKGADPQPPRWADRFLEWFCTPQLIEEIQGDLHEAFYNRCEQKGAMTARALFVFDVIRSISSDTVRLPRFHTQNAIDMFRNYLLIFFRKLSRRKAFAAINIAGLATSLAGALLIFLYITHELSFDKFNLNANRIYRVYCAYAKPGEDKREFAYTPPNLASTAEAEVAGIESAVRVEEQGGLLAKTNDRSFSERKFYRADSAFFSIFTTAFIEGTPGDALTKPNTVVLTRTTAEKYFGSAENAFNKELLINGSDRYNVSAIVEDLPAASHLHFDGLLSYDYVHQQFHRDNWLAHNPVTYIKLAPGSSAPVVQEQMRLMTERILEPIFKDRFGKTYSDTKAAGGLQEYRLQPLLDVHLYSSGISGEGQGDITYVYIFTAIGLMLLLIASFNYINLATARSTWEARNTGVRKILGASTVQMYKQFLIESVGTVAIALICALIIVQGVLMLDTAFVFQFIPFQHVPLNAIAAFAALAVLVGLLSGLIPARLLSSFDPVDVIKGQLVRGSSGHTLRQILVVGQFAGSMGLIMCTFLVSRQLQYMSELSLGFNKERLIVIPHADQLGDKNSVLKNMVSSLSAVEDVSLCYGALGVPSNNAAFTPVELIEANRSDVVVGIPIYIGDHDYLKTLGVKLLMGHTFPEGLSREHKQIILNQAALREVGWQDREEKDLVGKMIDVNGDRFELAGIVEDYHFKSLKEKIGPMSVLSHYWPVYNTLMVRLKPGPAGDAIAALEKSWREVTADVPFEFSFVDDDLNTLYSSEQSLGMLFTAFASMAIFVACLGLLGLAMFIAERHIKEISIRKILGASIHGIVFRLSKSMIVLIVVSFVIATPVAWYMMNRWLEGFAYRPPMSVFPFVFAGGATLGIAILTMSYQTVRAALTNPAETLRHE